MARVVVSTGSTTEGDGSTTDGDGSTTEGDGSTTDGDGSTTEGDGSTTEGGGSTTGGDRLLRDGQFVRYLVARTLSGAGNIVTLIALPILVYRISDSASLTALVAACEAAPYLLFGLFAGALADRWNRKRVMVTADVLSTALIATLPLAHWMGEVTVPHVLAVAFLGPAIAVFFDGAVFGAIPTLVGRGRIAEANAISWGIQSVNEIALPSLVGVALAVVHPSTLLTFDALTFAVSAAIIATIVRPMHDASRARAPLTVRLVFRDIGEGLAYLGHHAGVRTMTIIGFLQCVGGGGFFALMVVWIDRRLGVGTEGLRFGLVYGSWAVGGLVASLALPWLLRRYSAARIALGGTAVQLPGRVRRPGSHVVVAGCGGPDELEPVLLDDHDQLDLLPTTGHSRTSAGPREHGRPDAGLGRRLDWRLGPGGRRRRPDRARADPVRVRVHRGRLRRGGVDLAAAGGGAGSGLSELLADAGRQ